MAGLPFCAAWRWTGWAVPVVAIAACAAPVPEPRAEAPSPEVVAAELAWAASATAVFPADTPLAAPPEAPVALLPARRVVAYYGNPLSKRMGILGALPPDSMMRRLEAQAAEYERADPAHPATPALHLVTVVAQAEAGRDSMYRAAISDSVIERVAGWAASRGWLLILDIQPGRSSVREEVRRLESHLRLPNVHLALDPEFAMGSDGVPGQRIGTMDAADINRAIDRLAALVDDEVLPPKLLIVHRFAVSMVTGIERIRDDPRVQVVITMDGIGTPAQKLESYLATVPRTSSAFAGVKLFYDLDRPLMTVADVLRLDPVPLFVLYQ